MKVGFATRQPEILVSLACQSARRRNEMAHDFVFRKPRPYNILFEMRPHFIHDHHHPGSWWLQTNKPSSANKPCTQLIPLVPCWRLTLSTQIYLYAKQKKNEWALCHIMPYHIDQACREMKSCWFGPVVGCWQAGGYDCLEVCMLSPSFTIVA